MASPLRQIAAPIDAQYSSETIEALVLRSERRDGRSGWMPAIRGYWRKGMNRAEAPYPPLTPDVIGQHLRGDVHIGLYPLADDDTCWWVAADFDKEAAMLDALAYMKAARAQRLGDPRIKVRTYRW